MTTTRRALLRGAALTAAASAVAAVPASAQSPVRPRPRAGDPFTLGVASGEPDAHSVVLWTRLAHDPLAEDGFGGMPAKATEVDWELAEDERFTKIVRRGTTKAEPASGHSVHVEASGLKPGAEYFYRFRANGHLSPHGRTRTAPAAGVLSTPLLLCFASCAHYEYGYYTAYRHLAAEEPDLVAFLGDYQYENGGSSGKVRKHAGPETVSLANYRQRYAQYKADADLQAAHAIAPWTPVFDDHEVENNWAGEVPEESDHASRKEFLARRARAFQAYYENMPLRPAQRPDGSAIQLYRERAWGGLVNLHMLDTRQFRDDQLSGDGIKYDPHRKDAHRTIMGADQERWLGDRLRSSAARWDVLGQQVFFSQLDFTPGAGETNNMDAWDGYAANRDRIVDAWVAAKTRNVVVLTGDVHANWAADIKKRFTDPESPVVGTELVTTSITSNGDGSDTNKDTAGILKENPHVKFYNGQRGYVRTKFTPSEVRADYRVVPYVSRKGAPISTRASFTVADREPGLHRN
ncbi:alkaline phosphatase D family protein [Sciscionella sediminilitoris]|uniref:alkaline phosphatase D family protein n=1 Tax=Sciscionella sediminilitoris TaxID=1445613 RepID=UPI0004DF2C14|nr:alkaline phosphatase D family protein [Sciscionella sp. SE31]